MIETLWFGLSWHRVTFKLDAQLHATVRTKLTGMFPLAARRHADPRNLVQAHEEGRHAQRSARVTQVRLCNNCTLHD